MSSQPTDTNSLSPPPTMRTQSEMYTQSTTARPRSAIVPRTPPPDGDGGPRKTEGDFGFLTDAKVCLHCFVSPFFPSDSPPPHTRTLLPVSLTCDRVFKHVPVGPIGVSLLSGAWARLQVSCRTQRSHRFAIIILRKHIFVSIQFHKISILYDEHDKTPKSPDARINTFFREGRKRPLLHKSIIDKLKIFKIDVPYVGKKDQCTRQ